MVAPDRDRSGASNSLTLDAPIRVVRLDAAHLAGLRHAHRLRARGGHRHARGVGLEPDIVVSGINNIANLGDDVIYSGTVAAAMEGRFLGLPAVAVSLVTETHQGKHYETRGARGGGDRRAPAPRSAAGRHHPQRQRAGPAVGRDPRLRGQPPRPSPSRRAVHRRRKIRAAASGGGSAPPATSRTPAPAPISMPCAAAISRSRRSTST